MPACTVSRKSDKGDKIMTIRVFATFAFVLVTGGHLPAATQVEPNAGNWKTWVLANGSDLRLSPPPDKAATAGEAAWLRDFVRASRGSTEASRQMRYWTSGAPS